MVNIAAKYRGDTYCQQGEDGKDCSCRLAHIAHITVCNESDDCHYQRRNFYALVLNESEAEGACSRYKHDDVLDICAGIRAPEGRRIGRGQRDVALKHIYGIFLEGEDCRVIEYAEKCHQPEAERREDFAKVGNLEGVIFLFSLTCLSVKLAVHEEIDDEHYQGNHQQYYAESH